MRTAWLLVAALGLAACAGEAAGPPADTVVSPSRAPTVEAVAEEEPEPFDVTRHSTRDPRSPWVVVNKRRPLRPPTYAPELDIVEGYLVDPRVVRPLTRLLAAGRRHGLDLRLMSAYRSYGRQAQLHANAVAAQGPAQRTTAPAGASEHQTGLAVDLGRAATGACNVTACFAGTREGRWLRRHAHRFGFVLRYPAGSSAVTACFAGTREGRWLRRNAHRFGFVLRYPAGSSAITGYAHESWHFRFVGRPLARHLHRERIATLEEAFGLVARSS